jgi:protein-tyrosine-phosphatase
MFHMTTRKASQPMAPALTRRIFVIAAMAVAGPAWTAPPPCRKAKVLFVCPAGTVNSAIAREYLRQRAAERGVAVDVQSRGVNPEDHLTPALLERLKAEGINPRSEPISRMTMGDAVQNDIIVAFDEAAQAPGMEHARPWSIPSWNNRYAEAKSALLPKIDALIAELSGKACAG